MFNLNFFPIKAFRPLFKGYISTRHDKFIFLIYMYIEQICRQKKFALYNRVYIKASAYVSYFTHFIMSSVLLDTPCQHLGEPLHEPSLPQTSNRGFRMFY